MAIKLIDRSKQKINREIIANDRKQQAIKFEKKRSSKGWSRNNQGVSRLNRGGSPPSVVSVDRLFVIREFLEPLQVLADPVSRGLHLIPFLDGERMRFARFLSRSLSSSPLRVPSEFLARSQGDVLRFYFLREIRGAKTLSGIV